MSSPDSELGRTRPTSPGEVGRRIEDAATMVGGRKKASQICGVAIETIARWIREETRPNMEAMGILAESANIRLDWILTGERPMWKVHPLDKGVKDRRGIYGTSEEALRRRAAGPKALAGRIKVVSQYFEGGIEALSRATEIPLETLGRIQRGTVEPTRDQTAAIARATGTNPHWLMTGEIPPEHTQLHEITPPEQAVRVVPTLLMAAGEALRTAAGDHPIQWDELNTLARSLHDQVLAMSGGNTEAVAQLRPADLEGLARLALRLRQVT